MALSSPAAVAADNGPTDAASPTSLTPKSDPIAELGNAKRPCELAAWLDRHASSSSTQPHTADVSSTSSTTSKLDETSAALRQLSRSISSVRDASRLNIDQTITLLVATIPKIGIELKLMSETASTLQSRVTSLQSHSSGKDGSTDAALARIAAMCKAKAGLIDARHALREAQAWSTLESQVLMLLGEQRWQEAVDRVAKAADSLRLFSGSAKSNEQRTALLASLTAKIQEQLVPVLQDAVAARDADSVARTAKLLAQTQNGVSVFFQVYTKCRSEALLSRWSQTASETSNKPLPSQLNSLFGDILALLGEERLASSSLFTDPGTATQLLTADILARLDPPIHACIQQATRAPDLETFLVALTDAYKAAEEAIRAIQSIVPQSKVTQEKSEDDADAPPVAPIDSKLLTLTTTHKTWLRIILETFIPYQTRLATFEAEAMQSRLHSLQASSDPSGAASLSIASAQAVQVTKAALRRATALTKSFATPSLLPSLDGVFETAMGRVRSELELELNQVLSGVQGRIRRVHMSEGARQAALSYDERGEVLTSADWDEFRKATEKLSACKDAVAAVRALEETIAYQVSELGAVAKPPSKEAKLEEADFTSPASALATSSLNTASLHELIAKAKRILSTASWNAPSTDLLLLPAARTSILSIASTVHAFQHDLVLSQFLPELELYSLLSIWTSNKHPSIVNEYDLAMPKFSLSPTEAMARVGEAMLNLPRLFEGYADEALLFCLNPNESGANAVSTADSEVDAARTHTRHATMAVTDTGAGRSHMHRQAFSTTATPSVAEENSAEAAAAEDADAGVLSQYLRSLLSLFFKRLLGSVLPSLPRLTEIGAAQLAADLDYLSNISSVIYSESEGILRFWKKAAELSADTARALVAEYFVGVKGAGAASRTGLDEWDEPEVERFARSDAFRLVARLRGWI